MSESSKILRNRVMRYVADRGENVQQIGKTDLAFSVARQHNVWVTDATAHKYWCAIYDLELEGLITFSEDYSTKVGA
jgi:hypothetical protein